MRAGRVAALLLGAWLVGSALMVMVAAQNLVIADQLVAGGPGAARKISAQLGYETTRALLRYAASELNRWYFSAWEWAQLPLGLAAAVGLFAASRRRWLTVAGLLALGIVILERLFLTPEITRIGRGLDFAAGASFNPARLAFSNYHRAYSIAEVLKAGLLVAAAGGLLGAGSAGTNPDGSSSNKMVSTHRRTGPRSRGSASPGQGLATGGAEETGGRG